MIYLSNGKGINKLCVNYFLHSPQQILLDIFVGSHSCYVVTMEVFYSYMPVFYITNENEINIYIQYVT